MDQDTIQKIATEVAKHFPPYPWWANLIVQMLLMLLAGGLGAFLSEYLKTRGKNFATKTDFDTLLAQLRANTELVETIKAEVGQRDWAKREWANLRRTKLELLFQKLDDCLAYLDAIGSKAIAGAVYGERDPSNEAATIVALYFPTLTTDYMKFSQIFLSLKNNASDLVDLLRSTDEYHREPRDLARETYHQEHSKLYSECLEALEQLKAAGRKLLMETMGVFPPVDRTA